MGAGHFGFLDNNSLPELNESVRRHLSDAGVAEWFIQKAVRVSAKDMWYPTRDDLVRAGILEASQQEAPLNSPARGQLDEAVKWSGSELNKALPKMIDALTELNSTSAKGSTLIY